MCIQLQLLTTFLKGGVQLWILDELWTQVGILTGSLASSSDSNWSHEQVIVSHLVSVVLSYIDEIVPLILEN